MAKFLDQVGLKGTLQALKEKFVELTDKFKINATYTDSENQTQNTTVESDFNAAELTFKAEGDLTVKVENISGKPVITYNAVIPESQNSILYSIAPKTLTEEESGLYSTVYQLYKQEGEDGQKSAVEGSVINIPLDFLVKNAELKTCETADVPETGYEVGDKYIDFTINTKTTSKSSNTTHLYINLKDFVDVYVAGNGIDVTNKTISAIAKTNSGIAVTQDGIALDITESNGLGLTNGSLTLTLADSTMAGAMSSEDKSKLDGLEEMNALTSEEITSVINEVFPVSNP